MKLTFHISKQHKTHSGNPCIVFTCEHCRLATDLGGFLYSANLVNDPRCELRAAAQEFVWRINSGDTNLFHKGKTGKKLDQQLCHCDENPTGLIGSWFHTNTKEISNYDLELACAQICLYAIKDGLDPDSKEVKKEIREFKNAVRIHNKALKSC